MIITKSLDRAQYLTTQQGIRVLEAYDTAQLDLNLKNYTTSPFSDTVYPASLNRHLILTEKAWDLIGKRDCVVCEKHTHKRKGEVWVDPLDMSKRMLYWPHGKIRHAEGDVNIRLHDVRSETSDHLCDVCLCWVKRCGPGGGLILTTLKLGIMCDAHRNRKRNGLKDWDVALRK